MTLEKEKREALATPEMADEYIILHYPGRLIPLLFYKYFLNPNDT